MKNNLLFLLFSLSMQSMYAMENTKEHTRKLKKLSQENRRLNQEKAELQRFIIAQNVVMQENSQTSSKLANMVQVQHAALVPLVAHASSLKANNNILNAQNQTLRELTKPLAASAALTGVGVGMLIGAYYYSKDSNECTIL